MYEVLAEVGVREWVVPQPVLVAGPWLIWMRERRDAMDGVVDQKRD